MTASASEKKGKRPTVADVITREATVHLHKHVHGQAFKRRAPTAIKAIRAHAVKLMGTKDVRLEPTLNKAVWNHGVRNVPHRIRVRMSRRRNDDESAKEKLYTVVSFVRVASFKGLETETVDEE